MKMDERDIRTLSFLVSQGKGFPMRNMRDELTFDPGLGQTGHNGSSKVAGYFNNWHNVAPYLIFVISFTQTGFSKTKFYTQKND